MHRFAGIVINRQFDLVQQSRFIYNRLKLVYRKPNYNSGENYL